MELSVHCAIVAQSTLVQWTRQTLSQRGFHNGRQYDRYSTTPDPRYSMSGSILRRQIVLFDLVQECLVTDLKVVCRCLPIPSNTLQYLSNRGRLCFTL